MTRRRGFVVHAPLLAPLRDDTRGAAARAAAITASLARSVVAPARDHGARDAADRSAAPPANT